jgi:energy-coupling factor transport system ATP-binding protein
MLKEKKAMEVKMAEAPSNRVAVVENLEALYGAKNYVVRGLSFELGPGEMLLLVGSTGAGKTTVANILSGNVPRLVKAVANGRIFISGIDPRNAAVEEILSAVALVPQEPWNGIIGDTVENEMLISKMLSGEENVYSSDLEEELNIGRLYERTTFTLSAGETQKVAIVSRMNLGAKLIVLDEPLTYLDEESREKLKEIVRRLLSIGKSFVITGHEKDFWGDIASKVIELPHGKVEDLKNFTAGLDIKETNGHPTIEFRKVDYRYYPSKSYIFRDLNLKIEGKGIFLLRGPNGSGKTTLLRLISGLTRPKRGEVIVSHPMLFLPDNPLLFFSKPTAIEEIRSFGSFPKAEEFLGEELLRKKVKEMSSGQRRIVSLISAALSGKPILLMDEPTVGLDPYYKKAVLEILRALAEAGRMLVISTHDKTLEKIADDIIDVMKLRCTDC